MVVLGGVHHISLNVRDAAEACRFYVDVLGLTEIPRPDLGFPGHWLRTPDDREIHLLEVEDWVAPKGQHFAFRVDDLDTARAELSRAGVKVSDPIQVPDGGRQSFLRDPAGNLIELNEPRGR